VVLPQGTGLKNQDLSPSLTRQPCISVTAFQSPFKVVTLQCLVMYQNNLIFLNAIKQLDESQGYYAANGFYSIPQGK